MKASLRRIYAVVLRYALLLRGSPPRLFEAVYWPTLNILFLGFFNMYLLQRLGAKADYTLVLGASILLEFYLRPNISLLLAFVEEIYARNIVPLYTSPLRGFEQLLAYTAVMLLRLAVGMIPAVAVCGFLFHYNLLAHGWGMLPLLLNLIVSGAVCGFFLIALLIRFGQSAEWFGWMLGWFFIPFMGVYYPLDILPGWMHVLGLILPPSHVFEAFRALAAGTGGIGSLMLTASALNLVWLAASVATIFLTVRGARKRGNLLHLHEVL